MIRLHPLLSPYEPTDSDPFDAVKAAHLLNRAGFGGTLPEVNRVVALGPAAAVEELLKFPDAGIDDTPSAKGPDFSSVAGYPMSYRELGKMYLGKSDEGRKVTFVKQIIDNQTAIKATIEWWLDRMGHGPHPLQEKLALFWHGHFTTSAKDERAARLMWAQNELLRKHAAGNFGAFVKAISRDPAMLEYLNNQQNHKNHPNENYARELMELFTLGIGNYTEDDVKNAARAFTGRAHDGERFVGRPFDHDDGEKVFLGHHGTFDGDAIVDLILQHPACPQHIARKLFEFFVYETADGDVVESLAALLLESQYELRPVLRTILTSRAFYGSRAVGAQIKSPVQLTIGLMRQLAMRVADQTGNDKKYLLSALDLMGQVPFNPPNVRGWPGGRSWISTSTLFVRYNACVAIAGKAELVAAHWPAARTVDHWIGRLIQRTIGPRQRETLIAAIGSQPTAESVRKLVQLIVSMPEYQVC